MAVQVSYPGVYIEEFTPGAPIEGVGTSTLGAVGTATRGPINEARLVSSWDDFVRVFGDIPTDGANAGYLPQSMYGFFQNGGTQAYVVRAATGVQSFFDFLDGAGGTAFRARAITEGVAGDSITVEVTRSSALAAALDQAMASRNVTGINGTRDTLTLAAPDRARGIAVGTMVQVTKGALIHNARVNDVPTPDKITLDVPVPGGPSTTGFSVTFAPFVVARIADADIVIATDNADGTTTLELSSAVEFPAGTRLTLTDNATANPVDRTVRRAEPGDKVVVDTFPNVATYAGGAVRFADWSAGQRTLRLALPNAVGIGSVLPRGTTVQITPPGGGGAFVTTVEASGGDTITLAGGLPAAMALDDPTDLPMVESLEFDVEVTDPAVTPPEDRNAADFEAVRAQLAMHPDHPRYWAKTFTSRSVTLVEPTTPSAAVGDTRPVDATQMLTNGQDDDRTGAWTSITNDPDTFLNILRPIDEVAIVAIPGATDVVVQRAIIDHCESMHDRFAILDSERGGDLQQIRTQFAGVRSSLGFAALYYPWIKVRNPRAKKDELWPPSGHIAGVFARTDHLRGVHKAPANTDIRGAFAVERKLTDDEQGPLNLMGVNVIRVFPQQSTPVVWGARTTATDRNWQYVNIRRLFLFLEESIEEGIRWAVFEPNDLALWHKLKRSIGAFLTSVWRDGALFGATADKAFYVKIDESLNPPSTRALGRLYLEIGVVPTYPAEFIIVRIGIWDGGAEVSEA